MSASTALMTVTIPEPLMLPREGPRTPTERYPSCESAETVFCTFAPMRGGYKVVAPMRGGESHFLSKGYLMVWLPSSEGEVFFMISKKLEKLTVYHETQKSTLS